MTPSRDELPPKPPASQDNYGIEDLKSDEVSQSISWRWRHSAWTRWPAEFLVAEIVVSHLNSIFHARKIAE